MASLLEEIADALARDVLRAMEESGDETLVAELGRVIGASSTTTQEAFLTAVRVRMAEARARRLLAARLGVDWPLQPAAAGTPITGQHRTAWVPGLVSLSERERREDDLPVIENPEETARPPSPSAKVSETAEPAYPEDSGREIELDSGPQVPEGLEPEPAVTARQAEGEQTVRIRPRIPVPPSKPQVEPLASSPRSLEAALALATSLPRKSVPQGAPQAPLPTPYDDVEMPDGDWG